MECSAKSGEGMGEVFEYAVRLALLELEEEEVEEEGKPILCVGAAIRTFYELMIWWL